MSKPQFYEFLELPKLPADLKNQVLEASKSDDPTRMFNYGRLSIGNRKIYNGTNFVGLSSEYYRKKVSDEFEQWIKDNITLRFVDAGVSVTTPGYNLNGPHVDAGRCYVLIYPIQTGGPDAVTSFWKPKDGSGPINYKRYYNNYDELELVEQVKIPEETWCIIFNRVPHSVENISEGRITVQISVNYHPWKFM